MSQLYDSNVFLADAFSKEIDAAFDNAVFHQRADILQNVFAPRFSLISFTQQKVPRERVLFAILSDQRILKTPEWINYDFDDFNHCAITHGLARIELRLPNFEFVGEVWMTRQWVRDSGKWMLAGLQLTDARVDVAWQKMREKLG